MSATPQIQAPAKRSRRRAPGRLGLDIGRHSLKLAQLEPGDPPRLVTIGRTATPAGLYAADGYLTALEPLVEAVARLVDDLGLRGAEAQLAVGPPALALACVEPDPTLDESLDDLGREVLWSSFIDVEPLFASAAGADGRLLLAGLPRRLADELVLAVESAGLVPVGLDAAPLALCAALAPAGPLLIGDLGAGGTSWLWTVDGELLEMAWTGAGGAALSRALADRLGMNLAAAESYIAEGWSASAPPEPAAEAVSSWLDRLCEPLREPRRIDPSGVLLAGGTALWPGLAEALCDRLGLPVAVADPLAGVVTDESLPEPVRAASAGFALALGLARGAVEAEG